ncbi:exodeoxyribonuclease III [Pleionea sp. CnH1-48]|uniref:exodeoxyribonuclease III n=1 Tax=Pleionea sp. CnH1-48 TaxID=2954494 RepID=UPI0020971344|nr:exodeoxyribonuclease III [Pleionea sp. CnH1-48]MCO7222686.1 exodeoxyribonuclease III [Pleionea sp. CnH1-48]
MKVVSFNINSLRARIHQLEAVIEAHQPDVIGLQETKVADEAFPLDDLAHLGFHIDYHGQKGHYGVATLSKEKPIKVEKGFATDADDAQRRTIITYYQVGDRQIGVFNGYFPQGENREHETKFPAKQKYYADLMALVKERRDESLIIMGDFNISHQDHDIGIGPQNAKRWLRSGKCSFLPEEREWLNELMELGSLADTFRKHYPDVDDRYSWFDYRSKGFDDDPKRGLRIDLIVATPDLYEACTSAGIDYDIRGMEKPSDHCPIWSEFSL